ncbi:MAG: phosphoribosylformylglycinamidine cyclo-ligase [Chitinivibrionales bacterium]|nr:phosphoribosylformylglycinamidine cyclo-ligase [Chitinivibrionales bacterium]
MAHKPLTYADAGVNVAAWNKAKDGIGKLVSSTYNDRVLGAFGQFGGLFDISYLKEYDHPVLVSSIDGVGTKVKIAAQTGIHDFVGEDIVNHCIDDILVMGARPLFFLDYIGIGRLEGNILDTIVAGLARACKQSHLVLIGGETAEMPDVYSPGEYDLAGTIVGVIEKNAILEGNDIIPGDTIIGFRSNGLHTNGYTLARKIVTEIAGRSYGDTLDVTGKTFAEELLRPHKSYAALHEAIRTDAVKGCAHITGGGFADNIARVLPSNCDARIDTRTWKPDSIFTFMQRNAGVATEEMYRTFNMGIGFVIIVDRKSRDSILATKGVLKSQPVIIGEITAGNGSVKLEYAQ